MVTLVWLYLEILRLLLTRLRSRDSSLRRSIRILPECRANTVHAAFTFAGTAGLGNHGRSVSEPPVATPQKIRAVRAVSCRGFIRRGTVPFSQLSKMVIESVPWHALFL
jgi:hypothetical protein